MNTALRCLTVAVFLGCVALAGCEKKVELTFVNWTRQTRNVNVTVEGVGPDFIGVVTPKGGQLPYLLKVPKKDLPITCTWQAGDKGGQLSITGQTERRLWIDIKAKGPATVRNAHTEVIETHEKVIKNVPVLRGTVVK